MKLLTNSLFLAVFFLLNTVIANSQEEDERIIFFKSDIQVLKNSRVRVKETIRAYVTGEEIRHGIHRDLPIVYKTSTGFYHVDFDLLSVKKDGSASSYHEANYEGNRIIYIGDRNTYETPGIHTYTLVYEVGNVLLFKDHCDQFRWNVTGTNWSLCIDSLEANITFPKNASVLFSKGYTGHYGSKFHDYYLKEFPHKLQYTYDGPVYPGNNLTVDIGWEKGAIESPGAWSQLGMWMENNPMVFSVLLLLFCYLLFNLFVWYRYGKDLKPGVIVPQYDAPEGMCPAECGFMHEQGVDEHLFTATIISLAVQGFITIEEIQSKEKKWLYKISPTDKSGLPTNKTEALFFQAMFRYREYLVVNEDLPDPMLYSLSRFLQNNIEKEQGEKYVKSNSSLQIAQFIGMVFIFLSGILLAMNGLGPFWLSVATILASLLIYQFFTAHMEAPTPKGRQLMDHISGYILYMKYADTAILRTEVPLHAENFQKNLPYAIALGMSDLWVNKFELAELDSTIQATNWLHSSRPFHIFALRMSTFNSSLQSACTAAAASFSSGGGGSFGGGGGGGFSGGGFGGGGGGGW